MNTTKLCAYVKKPDGTKVLCRVVEHSIYNIDSYLPLMAVRAMQGEPLNAINKLYVPMLGIFAVSDTAGRVHSGSK